MQVLLLSRIRICDLPLNLLGRISDIARHFRRVLICWMGLWSLSHLDFERILALSSWMLLWDLKLIFRILLLVRWLLLEVCLRWSTSWSIVVWRNTALLYSFLAPIMRILWTPVISTPIWWHRTVTALIHHLISWAKAHCSGMSRAGNLNYWLTIWRFFHYFVNIIISDFVN